MTNKTRAKHLFIFMLIGLLISSSPNYAHLSIAQKSALVVANPNSYFAIAPELEVLPSQASAQLVKAIAGLQQPKWEFERLQRSLSAQEESSTKLLLLDAWPRLNRQQRQQVSEQLISLGQYHLLYALSKRYALNSELTSLLAVWQGKAVTTFLNNPYLGQFYTLSERQHSSVSCQFNLALIASDLDGLQHLQALKNAYERQPEPGKGTYCLSTPIYAANKLSCKTQRGFAVCDLQHEQSLSKYDHLVFMAAEGLANVSGRHMTLSASSTYNTLIHELMHFSGFEDEYPIPAKKAKWLCATSGQKAPNLYVGDQAPNNWAPSRTCELGKLPSYKPSNSHSLLEYQSIKLDENYRKRWLTVLNSRRLEDKIAVNSAE
ncbi:hypothetical protein CWC29_003665 [Pseudoalteromonas sp. S4498]|uniref:hypothetical protein n=1 Tax=Pseudoalteromonas TaxID=53246 RepID=UPI001108BC5E|nr:MULTISPECIES: hypothetical protein [Pseudoalteromonas]MCG9759054.1 hypothetical protein [Pseudoalteromonas sp. Isolate6]NKC17943.1 hypothetical protein [Pseudoalteromonas galatheae]